MGGASVDVSLTDGGTPWLTGTACDSRQVSNLMPSSRSRFESKPSDVSRGSGLDRTPSSNAANATVPGQPARQGKSDVRNLPLVAGKLAPASCYSLHRHHRPNPPRRPHPDNLPGNMAHLGVGFEAERKSIGVAGVPRLCSLSIGGVKWYSTPI